MFKKKHSYNPNSIKSKRAYSFKEIAEIYHLHSRTVQSWRKQGLKVIDYRSFPYLVIGQSVRDFIKQKRQNRKIKLKLGEFYCTKCHFSRKSCPDKISLEYTNKYLGKTSKQVIIKGVCEVCKNRIVMFSSTQKIEEMRNKGVLFREHHSGLIGNSHSSVNTDKEKEKEYVKSEY